MDWFTNGFVPKYNCSPGWTPMMQAFAAISELLVVIAYFALPGLLVTAARYLNRQDLKTPELVRAFKLFAAFILACGITHVAGIVIIWWPAEPLRISLTALTGLVSLYTLYRVRIDAKVIWGHLTGALYEKAIAGRFEWPAKAIRSSPYGYCRISKDGRFVRVNEAIEKITGRTTAELINGLTWMEITSPKTLAADEKLVRQLDRNEITSYSINKEYILPWGEARPVQITVRKAVENGEDGYDVWVKDMTEHINLVNRSETMERQLRADVKAKNARIMSLEHRVNDLADQVIRRSTSHPDQTNDNDTRASEEGDGRVGNEPRDDSDYRDNA